jgi:hypothetical protein
MTGKEAELGGKFSWKLSGSDVVNFCPATNGDSRLKQPGASGLAETV